MEGGCNSISKLESSFRVNLWITSVGVQKTVLMQDYRSPFNEPVDCYEVVVSANLLSDR